MNSRRVISIVYIALFSAAGIATGALALDARAHYNQLKHTEAVNRKRLADAEAELRRQEKILQRLRTDPAFVEKQIRKRLGYAKPGEVIFRFED